MLQIKYVIALVVVAVLAAIATFYATEKYVTERVLGQLAEVAMMRNSTYVTLVNDINGARYDAAKERLRKLFDLEAKEIQRTKGVLEDSCFASANREYIDRINRYLASPTSAAEFRINQRFAKGAAVDGDERTLTGTLGVDVARDHLFAGASLPDDQSGCITAGNPFDLGQQLT